MDTEAEEIMDFKTLRAKFQKSDLIKIKPNGKQASQAPGVSDTETVLNVTNIDIFETVTLHNAAVQQPNAKSLHPPLPLSKPAIVPKPVLLKLPDLTKASIPAENGGRPEDLTTSKGASVEISPNKLQKSKNQTSELRTSEDNTENDQLDTITFKEKLNIWENSLHCTAVSSGPAEKIKCAMLSPSLSSSGSNSSTVSKTQNCAEPLFQAISFTQTKKEDLSMEPEMQTSGSRNEIPHHREPTMLIQSSDDAQTTDNYEITVLSFPPKANLSTPQIDREGFKLDNHITVESEASPGLPHRFIRLDLANHPEPKFPVNRGEGAAHEKDHQYTAVQCLELPSIEVLGPPPVKPPRPFKVDLSALQNIKMASCSPMESSKKNGMPLSLISCPEEDKILSTESSTPEETSNKKEKQQKEMEKKNELQNLETKEKHQDQVKECENKEKRDKELQRKFNLTGLETPIYKVQVQEHVKGGKLGLTVKRGEMVEIIRMVDCPSGKWLAKSQDGNYGYIQIDAVKMDNTEIKEISKRMSKHPQIFEEIYDDVALSEILAKRMHEACIMSSCSIPVQSESLPLQFLKYSGQLYEAIDTKKESEKRNSANKMNPLTKILHKGKEKKRKGHESPSHALQSEFGSASYIYDDAISKVTGSQKSSSQYHFADEESLHEQVYDDAEASNTEPIQKERKKELGKLFKKEMGDGEREKKVKGRKDKSQNHLSANSRSQSTFSITNLESGESSMYEDVNNVKQHSDFEDRTSKSDTSKISWGNIFKKREENVKRIGEMSTKLEESEREKVKGMFKGKRKDLNEEKEAKVDKKKMLKEQEFREKFNYTKEILVANIAVVEHNVVQEKKGSLYLPIKSGEKLDVIDVGEGNQIICRNAEGKYGYVHVRHLIFGNQN